MKRGTVTVRVINDRTGWTKVIELSDDQYRSASIRMPFWDDVHGDYGLAVFALSGERDADGLPVFRTREQ